VRGIDFCRRLLISTADCRFFIDPIKRDGRRCHRDGYACRFRIGPLFDMLRTRGTLGSRWFQGGDGW
jgi:hypothetical protein